MADDFQNGSGVPLGEPPLGPPPDKELVAEYPEAELPIDAYASLQTKAQLGAALAPIMGSVAYRERVQELGKEMMMKVLEAPAGDKKEILMWQLLHKTLQLVSMNMHTIIAEGAEAAEKIVSKNYEDLTNGDDHV